VRSERAFGSIQGRHPQELRLAGICSYADANTYLQTTFVPDFNRRFTVTQADPESAFTLLAGIDLELLLSVQQARIVRNDNTVVFGKIDLQLPGTKDRIHFARCPVIVHQLLNGTFAISHQGRLVARFGKDGQLLRKGGHDSRAA
jgi:hypothetical protein